MDPRTTIVDAPPPRDGETVEADQAVFTSAPSRMAQGYRIVATSRGVQPDEKVEILRRAPSHGSLCAAGEDATGLIAFPLPGGRYAIGRVRHAGREHTSRGGLRVLTHFALLNDRAYERFGFDPTRVGACLERHTDVSQGQDGARLPELRLMPPVSTGTSPLPAATAVEDIRRIVDVHQAVLEHQPIVAHAADDSIALLARIVATLPRFSRGSLAVSAGLRHSPARGLDVCLTMDDARSSTMRAVRRMPVALNADPGHDSQPCEYDAWLRFVAHLLGENREAELVEFADAMREHIPAVSIERAVAAWCDLESIQLVDDSDLPALAARFEAHPTRSDAERLIVTRLCAAIGRRIAALSPTEGGEQVHFGFVAPQDGLGGSSTDLSDRAHRGLNSIRLP